MQLLGPHFIRGLDDASPARIYSAATEAGALASLTLMNGGGKYRPAQLPCVADAKLEKPSKDANEIYVYELFARVATVYKLRLPL